MTPKCILWRTVKTLMKCSIMMHIYHKAKFLVWSESKLLHAPIQKVLPERVKLWKNCFFGFFLDDEGERIQIPLKMGHHRPTSGTPFKWHFSTLFKRCFSGVPITAQHWMLYDFLRDLEKHYIFMIFQGGPDPLSRSLDPPIVCKGLQLSADNKRDHW